ncbi:MAG: AbfB domain-containing protein [Aquabacterium sp.]|nr:AbfB domain-containing protein [Aquabacterium sp.]
MRVLVFLIACRLPAVPWALWTAGLLAGLLATTAPVLAASLRAQWNFETISASTTPDSSGNGNTMSLAASGVTQPTGRTGLGLGVNGSFPASGTSAGATVDTTGSFTVQAWVRFTAMTDCMAQSVVAQDASITSPFQITLIPNCGLPQPLFFLIRNSDADGAGSTRVLSTFTPVVNTWYHLTGVRNVEAGTMSFYINCTLQGTASTSAAWASSGPFTVGRARFSSSQRDFVNGTIDTVKVWSGALTAQEVATECSTHGATTPIAWWLFNEPNWTGLAGEVRDSVGGHHAQASGLSSTRPTLATGSPAIAGSPGTCGYGVFNRSNKQHVLLPSSFPNLGSSGSFTVTAWFRTTDNSQGGQRIFADDENNASGWSNGMLLSLGDRGAGRLNFLTRAQPTTGRELITPNQVANNTWYHVAFGVEFGTRTKFLRLTDASGNELSNLSVVFPEASIGQDTGLASIGGETNSANGETNANFGFAGNIDDVQVFSSALSAADIDLIRQQTSSCARRLTAGQAYSLESSLLANHYLRTDSSALGVVQELSGASSLADRQSASFIARAGLADANCWSFESVGQPGRYLRHQNNRIRLDPNSADSLYLNDATFCELPGRANSNGLTLESRNYAQYYLRHFTDLTVSIGTAGTGTFDASATWNVRVALSAATAPAVLRIEHPSGTGLTCTPSTVTVRACLNADCSQIYTDGVTGTLGASGGTVVWPDGAGFSIPAGSSTATVRLQSTSANPTVLGVASSTPTASNAATCNFGSPGCTFTAADAGFNFDVTNEWAEVSQTLLVRAVRKSNNSLDCVPAFVNLTRNVNFACSYTNPTTGTLPVRVGGNALNASGNAAAACDSGGRSASLTFNASGIATTTMQYADVGQMALSATYTGSAGTGDTGLVMTGSDSFISAPDGFHVTGVTTGPIRAGSSFSATVTARNRLGNTTPNFGRETTPLDVTLGWVRIQPTGTGAANGSFSGSLGSFSNGSASAGNLAWTEVGRGDLLARAANTTGYLDSSLRGLGSSAANGTQHCADEGGNCVLPGGTTATVYYGENNSYRALTGRTGTVACNNTNFGGDPMSGWFKRCWYAPTSATTGSVGDFIPHRFTVAASNACGSFSYAGQPITTTVTARNAAGNTTVNFSGTATTTPGFAQAVTLADANNLGLGTLAGASIAAAAFSAGVASATPSYSFTSKTTAPQSLVLRATNGGSGAALVSSLGDTEPVLPLRSGRLRLANAFGKATVALQVPVVAEYWGGSAWQPNSADSCTALAATSVAISNPRGATGGASTATSGAGAVAVSSGSGTLTLAAPSPTGSSLSLDLAINLGSTGTDQSCNGTRPATTGAGLPWLRALNGSCAATADRDPAARASFGIFAPETRKTVHARDLY